MGQVWPSATNLPAQRQSAPTQLHKNQVWVFGCQISQLLQKERHGNNRHEAKAMPSIIRGHQRWSTLRETSSRCYSALVNGWTGDLPRFSGFFQAPQSNMCVLRA